MLSAQIKTDVKYTNYVTGKQTVVISVVVDFLLNQTSEQKQLCLG